jgi:hypothetical protein
MFIVFLSCSLFSVFASGKTDLPQNYIDIDDLDFVENKTYDSVNLPYTKPAGFTKIIHSPVIGLIIDELIVDGKEIHPKRPLWDAGTYEAITKSYEEDTEPEEGEYCMPMTWGTNYGDNKTADEYLSEGIDFSYHTKGEEIDYSPTHYNIPYGSKEVFITYRIRFPDYSEENDFRSYIISESYTARFHIIWPEVRVADETGKIAPPENYEDLGTFTINAENELILDVPFQELSSDKFNPFIDNRRWITIYELISDGIIINEQPITINEKNNIDVLVEHDGVRETERIVAMKFVTNNSIENGIAFYSRQENPTIKYIIPYGTREIFMTYDIIFKETVGYVNYNKRLCVRWEIDWD